MYNLSDINFNININELKIGTDKLENKHFAIKWKKKKKNRREWVGGICYKNAIPI